MFSIFSWPIGGGVKRLTHGPGKLENSKYRLTIEELVN